MIVYHVTTINKLRKYLRSGFIAAPVRAWENIQQAERMSKSTARRVILRLKFPETADKLPGHFGQARVLQRNYPLTNF